MGVHLWTADLPGHILTIRQHIGCPAVQASRRLDINRNLLSQPADGGFIGEINLPLQRHPSHDAVRHAVSKYR